MGYSIASGGGGGGGGRLCRAKIKHFPIYDKSVFKLLT